jgi:exopolyphosphatase/pppGpp-phosphohydrolase
MKQIEIAERADLLSDLYATCRAVHASGSIAVLHIAADYVLLAIGTDKRPEIAVQFEIGSAKTAQESFKHNPPTPGEVENAIVAVEDEVMQAAKMIPVATHLVTCDGGIDEIFRQLDPYQQKTDHRLYRHDLEAVFGRYAAIVSGRPASADTLPQTPSFAATLLILREVMFHLNFAEIEIISTSPAC